MNHFWWLWGFVLLAQGARKGKTTTTTQSTETQYVSPLKHDVSIVTQRNFELSISKARDRVPAAVLYYQRTEAARGFIDTKWDVVAKELKGMVKIGAADCEKHPEFCRQQDAINFQDYLVRVYPVLPQAPYIFAGNLNEGVAQISSQLAKLIPDARISNITDDKSLQNFIGQFPALPKVILFTDKSKASRLFHALGTTFQDNMMFGMVTGDVSGNIAKRFKIRKLPTLLLKRGDMTPTTKGASIYKGQLKFIDIHEWLNVHSETFVKGGGFITETEPDPKAQTDLRPWLLQSIPEVTKSSHKDVCFKKPKGFCVIYLKWGAQLEPSELEMLEKLADEFSKVQKPELHWSWMNMDIESHYAKLFKMSSEAKHPSLVVFNPHNRLRFSKLANDQEASEVDFRAFVNKVVAGEGRFTIIKGNIVPAFVVRSRKSKTSKDEETSLDKEEL